MSASTIVTFTGKTVDPLAIALDAIWIEDIAHHLSQLCRFTGATRAFYSVAEHSVRVSMMAERMAPTRADGPLFGLYGLIHDGSEAYLCDVARPVKMSDAFADYRTIEADLQAHIYRRFGLSPTLPAEVVAADDLMLAVEFRDLMTNPPRSFVDTAANLATIRPMSPISAEAKFLARFEELGGWHHAS